MATTIANATLTVVTTETVSLNGKQYGNTNTLTIADINEVDQRIMTVPTSLIEVVAYDTTAGAGTFVRANVKYLRITNKDTINFISLFVEDGGSDHYWVKLEAGKSFELHNGLVETASPFSAWANISAISAIADTSAVDIEYFIALS
jgi:hypothetical protein